MRRNKSDPPLDVEGTIYIRKDGGRKLHLFWRGMTYDNARKFVKEREGYIALWQPLNDSSRMFYLFPDA